MFLLYCRLVLCQRHRRHEKNIVIRYSKGHGVAYYTARIRQNHGTADLTQYWSTSAVYKQCTRMRHSLVNE